MEFNQTGLPQHPDIAEAFAAADAYYTAKGLPADFAASLTYARILSNTLVTRDPAIIAGALLVAGIEKDPQAFGTATEAARWAQRYVAHKMLPVDSIRFDLARNIYGLTQIAALDAAGIAGIEGPDADVFRAAHERHRRDRYQLMFNKLTMLHVNALQQMQEKEPQLTKLFFNTVSQTKEQLESPLPDVQSPAARSLATRPKP